jgi:hypothetical protein
MPLPKNSKEPANVSLGHVLIAFVVILIFLAPIAMKFLLPDSQTTAWITTGIRVIWFYVVSYTSLLGFLFWIDSRARNRSSKQ